MVLRILMLVFRILYMFWSLSLYEKHMRYIFKNENEINYISDEYIRNGLIDDLKKLVHIQIEKYLEQEKAMIKYMNTILNNIEGIKNRR